MVKNKKILIIQRVITPYRLELLKELCEYFHEVGIVTSRGDSKGTLKKANFNDIHFSNLKIHELKSYKINYKGESRSTSLFFYPSVLRLIKRYDYLVIEGTTNIINNLYMVPLAKVLNKFIIWWDSGYSPSIRTTRRKVIDAIVKPLIKMTDKQMAYSSKGEHYLRKHMGGDNAFLNLNTINTNYFESIRSEVEKSILQYKFNSDVVKLLYVGVVEERKKVEELVNQITQLNSKNLERSYTLDVVGGGNQLDKLIDKYQSAAIRFHGPIYDKEKLKQYYFYSDLFVLPGDGGLAILQSLLYGLPVLCLHGADGTEVDYISDKEFLLENTDQIFGFLQNLKSIDRTQYLDYVDNVSSKIWIERLISVLPQ